MWISQKKLGQAVNLVIKVAYQKGYEAALRDVNAQQGPKHSAVDEDFLAAQRHNFNNQ